VRIWHGSYLYKGQKLCRVSDGIAKMYDALAKKLQNRDIEKIPAAVVAYKKEHLPTLAVSTRAEVDRRLNVFSKDFSDFTVADVTPVDIRLSIKTLYTSNGKAGAASHYKAAVSSFFRWCVESGLRTDNPCREIWVRKAPKHKSKWTDELFHGVRDKLSPMHQCYIDLSVLLYQRTTDVRQLKRSQIQNGVIRFEPTKTEHSSGAEVDIPITEAIQSVLDKAAAVSRQWKMVCPFVVHSRGGTAYTRSGVYSAIMRAAKAIGATGLNPKDLRPFAASRAKQLGYTLEQLKVGLAHTTITTTEGYVQQHTVPVSQIVLSLPPKKP
jgi:integrase